MPLLEIEEVTRYFGGLRALDRVTLHVNGGEVVSIIGPNGSGKTTLFNIITGFLKATKGKVKFEGNDISGLSAYRISQEGIGRTFQITTLFESLSVLENVIVGFHCRTNHKVIDTLIRNRSYYREEKNCLARAKEMLDFVGLGGSENNFPGQLPFFSRKRLAIAIALIANPRLLLLDEPVAGINIEEINSMTILFKRIHESGVTICLIDHKMKFVMAFCDRVIVLNEGQKIAEGTPDKVSKDESVIAAYLGS
jgi:branched-chain amino acid transport system ATP-binding protein